MDSIRAPQISGNKSLSDVTKDVCDIMERKPQKFWWFGISLALSALTLGIISISYQISTGIGTWGLNKTVGWAFDITNFNLLA